MSCLSPLLSGCAVCDELICDILAMIPLSASWLTFLILVDTAILILLLLCLILMAFVPYQSSVTSIALADLASALVEPTIVPVFPYTHPAHILHHYADSWRDRWCSGAEIRELIIHPNGTSSEVTSYYPTSPRGVRQHFFDVITFKGNKRTRSRISLASYKTQCVEALRIICWKDNACAVVRKVFTDAKSGGDDAIDCTLCSQKGISYREKH
eukprot:TRINITY_DN26245_c0_g1_i1.p1 TRINITY_DN26245_c0_g1~~TRINITY_DN26245_c0_g1_i1.p1  ORF type:complete len:212 (+),score=30.10 TRINITY_DN26245_c0_g1_i1:163-798(+)